MTVSFAIVAYNEEKTLPRLLDDLKTQDYPHDQIEVLLIDSMSTDATWQIMADFARTAADFARVLTLKNPKKNIPAGHNVALAHYTGEALIRVDAHASMPPKHSFGRMWRCSKAARTCAAGAGRISSTRPRRGSRRCWLRSSRCSAAALPRTATVRKKMYTKSLFCGMYRRKVYDTVGRYNELLPRSEDNDMTQRVRAAASAFASARISYFTSIRAAPSGKC